MVVDRAELGPDDRDYLSPVARMELVCRTPSQRCAPVITDLLWIEQSITNKLETHQSILQNWGMISASATIRVKLNSYAVSTIC